MWLSVNSRRNKPEKSMGMLGTTLERSKIDVTVSQ
jgi:hypothetical protein